MTILNKKRKNAKLFIKQLIINSIDISKVFLFGSVVKGKPKRDSDIDLIIFCKHPKKIYNKAKDEAFDFLLEKNEIIEPQVYSEKDYKNPSSYFVWQAIKQGERIY